MCRSLAVSAIQNTGRALRGPLPPSKRYRELRASARSERSPKELSEQALGDGTMKPEMRTCFQEKYGQPRTKGRSGTSRRSAFFSVTVTPRCSKSASTIRAGATLPSVARRRTGCASCGRSDLEVTHPPRDARGGCRSGQASASVVERLKRGGVAARIGVIAGHIVGILLLAWVGGRRSFV
jgi:hypothetical protein